jgi:hypothetical protein
LNLILTKRDERRLSTGLHMIHELYTIFRKEYDHGKPLSAQLLADLDTLITLLTNFKDLVESQNRVADQLGEAEKEIARLNKIIKTLESTALNELK